METPNSTLPQSQAASPSPVTRWTEVGIWLLHRNPLYLLSAAAMALAARLLLVDPDTRAGDVAHILLTLVVLQLYELVVSGIIVLLHRFRRSPEDLPSLLLVGTIFWTAPLAATAELTARHGWVGVALAAAAAILAATEFEAVRRLVKLRISIFGRAAAFSILALIALLPAFLLPSDASGRANEHALLAGWWLAATVLILIASAMSASAPTAAVPESDVRDVRRARIELAWLLLLCAIAAVQLIGMNHAFYLHATPAYAAPLLILLALVLIESRSWFGDASAVAPIGVFLLPLIGLVLATTGVDPKYVQPHTHWLLAHPIAAASLLAGLVWWHAYRRGCGVAFLHLGTAATVLAFGVWIAGQGGAFSMDALQSPVEGPPQAADARFRVAAVALLASTYFAATAILRRNRLEGVIALTLAASGVLIATWRLVPADRAIAAITLFWFWFTALHVVAPRPTTFQLVLAVAFGVAATLWLDTQSASRVWAWLHAPLIPLTLVALWRFTARGEYAGLAAGAIAIPLAYLSLRGASQIRLSAGAFAASAAFALLVAGACVSWFKTALRMGVEVPDAAPGAREAQAE